MENVVYLFGAGFSAPLGVPVIANFLSKSKDLYALNAAEYPHFKKVFATIDKMHVAKTFYDTDLLNIEEILSILDMEDTVSKSDRSAIVAEYIKDVILAYAPEFKSVSNPNAELGGHNGRIFCTDRMKDYYVQFVAALANLNVYQTQMMRQPIVWNREYDLPERPETRYSVITLNYDRIIEKAITTIIGSCTRSAGEVELGKRLIVAELHGSTAEGVVAPTWRKNMEKTRPAWSHAYDVLKQANKIRILGYSLPISDSYIRYLFKAAVVHSDNLKQIDIISLDPTGALKKTYRDFITFKNVRFKSVDITRYLEMSYFWKSVDHGKGTILLQFTELEECHERFMNSNW